MDGFATRERMDVFDFPWIPQANSSTDSSGGDSFKTALLTQTASSGKISRFLSSLHEHLNVGALVDRKGTQLFVSAQA